MLFRSNIGTWCKGTEKYGHGEKVTIAITCNLLATYLQPIFISFSEDSLARILP